MGDVSETLSVSGFSSDFIIDNGVYNTFEGVFNYDTPLVEAINAYFQKHNEAPLLELSICTYASGSAGTSLKSGDDAESRVTQVYLEAVYEAKQCIDIHRKINGAWTQARFACQKQNGIWLRSF